MAPSKMVTVEKAREIIMKQVKPLGEVSVDLREASGRVLAEDIIAREAIPPFDNSAMDGYAIRAEDDLTGVLPNGQAGRTLQVVGEVPAGGTTGTVVLPGQAIRIMTGAPIPEGADAVVPLESVESIVGSRRLQPALSKVKSHKQNAKIAISNEKCEEIKVQKEVKRGENIRRKGEEIQPGMLLLKKGKRLKPADVGVLASLGFSKVKVMEQPKVAILATGDELLEVAEPLEPGKIRNSNSYALSSLFKSYGALTMDLGIVNDEREKIRKKVGMALREDVCGTEIHVFVTVGGVSVGDYDLVQEVLKDLGMEVLFWKVAVKPGKPMLFGKIIHRRDTLLCRKGYGGFATEDAEKDLNEKRKILVFGLPGNPVSAMVTSELFIKPALYKMMGSDWKPMVVRATFKGRGGVTPPLQRKDEREWYVTAVTEYQNGGFITTLTSSQGSSLLTSFSEANSLIRIGMDTDGVQEGDEVEVILMENTEW